MTEIKLDKRNYRIHDDRNKDLIRKSLNTYGAGRSILLDADGEIIAGNGVYEQAKELNALGVYVVCEGVHFCMRSRGVKKQDASMITSAVRGIFKKDAKARQEFLSLIKM